MPLQVSVPVMVPEEVSLIAEAVGNTMSPVIVESNKRVTNDTLF